MNLVHFCFLADLAVRAVLNISAVLLKHPTFGGIFHIFIGKTNKKFEFLYIAPSHFMSNHCGSCSCDDKNRSSV